MKLFIPNHLRKIKPIDQLMILAETYAKENVGRDNINTSSFSDYEYYLSTDPVSRFLVMVYPREIPNDDPGSRITYLTHLFYSVSGTRKVIEFLEKLTGFNGKIDYKVTEVRVSVNEIPNGVEENTYFEALSDFLGTLLYFNNFIVESSERNLKIKGTLEIETGYNLGLYQLWGVDYEENLNVLEWN